MKIRLLDGWARKVSLPLVIPVILGWILYVIGFALFNYESEFYDDLNKANSDVYPDRDHRADEDWTPHWLLIASGPLLFINAIIHLIIGRWFTGLSTHFLTVVYLAAGGAVLYRDGGELFSDNPSSMNRMAKLWNDIDRKDFITEEDNGLYMFIGFIGAVVSVLFVMVFMVMWAFHTDASQPPDQVVASSAKPNQWEMETK